MNLHAIVNPIIAAVNPNVTGTLRVSTGNIVGRAGKQEPVYLSTPGVVMQFQALTAKDIEHLDNLNIQGVTRAVYLYGNVTGVVRPEAKGGDLLDALGKTWLVTVVFETWDTAGWCKVGVTLQNPPANVPPS